MTVKKVTKIEKEFIEKKEQDKSKFATQLVTLRIPENLLEEIDAEVLSRPLKTSRNAWILEVLYNKINDIKFGPLFIHSYSVEIIK